MEIFIGFLFISGLILALIGDILKPVGTLCLTASAIFAFFLGFQTQEVNWIYVAVASAVAAGYLVFTMMNRDGSKDLSSSSM